MTDPNRASMYGGLLGKIAFNGDMAAEGHTQEQIDELWAARFPVPEPPSNVVFGVDFTKVRE